MINKIYNVTIISKEKIYDKTGWYYLHNNMFGKVDVDNNIINAVILNGKWLPYSTDSNKIKNEGFFIIENISLLNSYKLEKNNLSSKLEEKNQISLEIDNEIDNRNNLINQLKSEINYQEKTPAKRYIIFI